MADVICPGCKGRFHETNDHYRHNAKSHNGVMFKLKEKYGPKGFNWTSFPNNTGIKCGDLECPSCGAPYCAGGFRVTVTSTRAPEVLVSSPATTFAFEKHTLIPPEQPPAEAHVCEECGKVCKSYAGLVAHRRFSGHGNHDE